MGRQKEKLFQALEDPSKVSVPKKNQKNVEKQPVEAYQDAPVILQLWIKLTKVMILSMSPSW